MKAKRIANMTRAQFVMRVEETVPSSVASRAIQEGAIEVLGLFDEPWMCWVVQVERAHRTDYFYVKERRRGRIEVGWYDLLPPWSLWIGDQVEASPINLGDNPDNYAAWRDQAIRVLHGGRSE
jgi:hypothetical protein